MCDNPFPREMERTCLFPAHKESMNSQSRDSTKVHVDEPMSFIGVTNRDIEEKVPARTEMN